MTFRTIILLVLLYVIPLIINYKIVQCEYKNKMTDAKPNLMDALFTFLPIVNCGMLILFSMFLIQEKLGELDWDKVFRIGEKFSQKINWSKVFRVEKKE